MDRRSIASVLEEIAVLLELQGENPFKVRAYQQAARTVTVMEEEPAGLVEGERLADVPGIGKALSQKITELVRTGRLAYLDTLRAAVPAGLVDMLRVPGLGPKKVRELHRELGISSLGELEYACRENRLIGLKGFGLKTQANILRGIEHLKQYRGRFLWAEAEPSALALVDALGACSSVRRVEAAGSFRRCKEIVKDLDLVAVSSDPSQVRTFLEQLDLVETVVSGGETKMTIRLTTGLNADLRLVSADEFPFALHHFTGSKDHNTLMRTRAKSRGMKLNEYGLFDGAGETPRVRDEAGVFGLLDLPVIPPELREGAGEIEAAENGTLPDLITVADIRGVFHLHSLDSDGRLTIEQLLDACRERGYEYMGVSDHSRSAYYAGGLTLDDVRRQSDDVLRLRDRYGDFLLFWGIESDIQPDGSLDYPDDVLAGFDFVIASVHSHFSMTAKEMTDRLIRAVRNPYTTILGHPTGRLLLAREPYPLDLAAVLEAAAEAGTIVEINANPHRLDLDWREMRLAKALGLKMMINPDAHSAEGLNDVRFGVNAARKGWLTRTDVLNTLSGSAMLHFLEDFRTRRRS